MNIYIGLDVGGTGIKASLVSENGNLLLDISHYDAMAKKDKKTIINNIVNIIIEQIENYNNFDNFKILGVGIAFPGPFDYKNGISLMKGINKYDSIYNVNMKKEIKDILINHELFSKFLSDNFDIKFENDAVMYGEGEVLLQNLYNKKVMCVCIGTGAGSCFLENGKPIKNRKDVPTDGFIYNYPFKETIIDDYISARGIIAIYKNISDNHSDNVKEIADLALNNKTTAIKTFEKFGENLGKSINIFINNFNPDVLILGGKISKSFDLFKNSFYNNIDKKDLEVKLSNDSSLSTIVGVINLFKN